MFTCRFQISELGVLELGKAMSHKWHIVMDNFDNLYTIFALIGHSPVGHIHSEEWA